MARRAVPAINVRSGALGVEWLLCTAYPGPVSGWCSLPRDVGAVLTRLLVDSQRAVRRAERQRHIGRIGWARRWAGSWAGARRSARPRTCGPTKILLVLAALQLACGGHAVPVRRDERAPAGPAKPRGRGGGFRVVTRSQLLRNVAASWCSARWRRLMTTCQADIFGVSLEAGSCARSRSSTRDQRDHGIIQIGYAPPLIRRLASAGRGHAAESRSRCSHVRLAIRCAGGGDRAGAELVTQLARTAGSSCCCAAREDDKRPTKVVARRRRHRIGDLLGAQLSAHPVSVDRAAAASGATVGQVCARVIIAMRLPRSYTMALEDAARARGGAGGRRAEPEPWDHADGSGWARPASFAPLSMRFREVSLHSARTTSGPDATGAARRGHPPPSRSSTTTCRCRSPTCGHRIPAHQAGCSAIKLTPSWRRTRSACSARPGRRRGR